MDIEVVDFYFTTKTEDLSKWAGTLHVYIPELDMDLRGVFANYDSSRSRKWNFQLPFKIKEDPETKKRISYPIINFTNHKKTLELKRQIQYRGKPYIQKNYLGMDVEEPPRAVRKPNGFKKKPFRKPFKRQEQRPQQQNLWKHEGTGQAYKPVSSSFRTTKRSDFRKPM